MRRATLIVPSSTTQLSVDVKYVLTLPSFEYFSSVI